MGAANSDSTGRAYAGAWDRFHQAVGPSRSLPATPEVIANYPALLSMPPCNWQSSPSDEKIFR